MYIFVLFDCLKQDTLLFKILYVVFTNITWNTICIILTAKTDEKLPTIVYYHGGGWTIGSIGLFLY